MSFVIQSNTPATGPTLGNAKVISGIFASISTVKPLFAFNLTNGENVVEADNGTSTKKLTGPDLVDGTLDDFAGNSKTTAEFLDFTGFGVDADDGAGSNPILHDGTDPIRVGTDAALKFVNNRFMAISSGIFSTSTPFAAWVLVKPPSTIDNFHECLTMAGQFHCQILLSSDGNGELTMRNDSISNSISSGVTSKNQLYSVYAEFVDGTSAIYVNGDQKGTKFLPDITADRMILGANENASPPDSADDSHILGAALWENLPTDDERDSFLELVNRRFGLSSV